MRELISTSASAAAIVVLLFAGARAQSIISSSPAASSSAHHGPHAVLPHCRQPAASAQTIRVVSVAARVDIVERVASTTLDIELRNPTSGRLEAEVLVPVPDGATVKSFAFHGSAPEAKAVLLPKDEARRTYDSIVAKLRDPALLEFIGYGSIRSSVFPVEAGGAQKVRIAYEHIVPVDGARMDYVLPRSESLEYEVPWTIDVRIESTSPLSTVYSPTHGIEVSRSSPGRLSARLASSGAQVPGAFQLCALQQGAEGVSTTVLACPDPKTGGGWFLLLAGVPAEEHGSPPDRREVTLVIDRSGSMRGEKLEQAREAALQVLAGLADGEAFQIIAYDDGLTSFSNEAVVKTRESAARASAFIRSLQAGSGTNIHAALVEAVRPAPREGFLPIVLFLTDGLPTVGETSESAIRSAVTATNRHARRVFTFGVGADVNTHLLEKIAGDSRGAPTFVLPGQSVEPRVSQVFARLSGPVLEGPALAVAARSGESRGEDVLPSRLPDLFRGDQLVALGRYRGSEPLVLTVRGMQHGSQRIYTAELDPARASARNAFVPRLWASRKIGVLVDAVREIGATPSPGGPEDPRLKELTGEIVRLSTEYGTLTEYTAFLATEGTDLARRDEVLASALLNCRSRAVEARSGLSSLNQSLNTQFQMNQTCLNRRNDYVGADMQVVQESRVQQVNDLAFFRKGSAWIDSRVYAVGSKPEPKRTAAFGTPEYARILDLLAASHRQGCASLRGDVMVLVDGELVLLEGPRTE
jgi:Ca-activated chloride channel family protein